MKKKLLVWAKHIWWYRPWNRVKLIVAVDSVIILERPMSQFEARCVMLVKWFVDFVGLPINPSPDRRWDWMIFDA